MTDSAAIAKLEERDRQLAEIRSHAPEAAGPTKLSIVLAQAEAAGEWMYDDAEYMREEARAQVRHRRELLAEAAPEITLEDFDRLALCTEELTYSMRAVRAWAQRLTTDSPGAPRRMLVLLGGKGCGKSVAASWLLARVRGRFITCERLRVLSGSYAPLDRAESDAVSRAKLLVLDEAGAEKGDARADVLRLLNRRQNGQLTIITSNLDEPTFRAWLDERALSRVIQLGNIWTVTGDDMRLRGVT